ncbi:amidase [Microthyrium microscopicum]|uniref:amidase n=1 Tax=Microthyrium microscopicum TaxID=703497 RepID=A0A6A6UWU0_9PEZI|nr:amidase [Microthyrium microscopicum]
MIETWRPIAKEAQDYRDSTIAELPGSIPKTLPNLPKKVVEILPELLPAVETTIVCLSTSSLVNQISGGRISASDATMAYLKRAAMAQQLTSCITELLPETALSRARHLDEFWAEHKKPIGPLHGLCISVKECIGMQGLRLSSGYCTFWNHPPPKSDALVLRILTRAGAIFHARTTVPQTMAQLETVSSLWGTTVNPWNTDTSSGGSSGGESALIACGGSVLGIGTDTAGSVRIPAAACGLYGFKPTAFRIPTIGWSSTLPGADTLLTTLGPLCKDLDGIELFMQPSLIPMLWTPVEISASAEMPLRIGIMWHDEVVLPHPPINRALKNIVSRLSVLPNIAIADFKPYKHDEAWAIFSSLYFTDGGAEEHELLSRMGEPMQPLAKWIIDDNPCVNKLTREEQDYWLEKREEYRIEYVKHWNETGSFNDQNGKWEGTFDVIICPVAPWVASRHGTARYMSYTSVWNLLDYPALAVPTSEFEIDGFVDKNLDGAERTEDFVSDVDEEMRQMWDPEFYHGMPLSLQLVTRRFQDEKLIAITRYLRDQFRESVDILGDSDSMQL